MIGEALFDLRVSEWGSFISASFCTKLIADLGTEVKKGVSPGTGDGFGRTDIKGIPNNEKCGIIPIFK